MLLLDGSSLRIAKDYSKPFWSYKFNKSGLRYEVALCIQTGSICWWIKPYAPGKWNDLSIFRDGLVWLEQGEMCETDRGYQGAAPTYIKCPDVVEADPATKEIQQRVRSRQESANERLKNWAICPARTVTTCWSTNLFLVILLFTPSF